MQPLGWALAFKIVYFLKNPQKIYPLSTTVIAALGYVVEVS